MSKEFPQEFALDNTSKFQGGGNGVKYFKVDSLPKLITSGNKIMQDIGHVTICEILEGAPIIQKLIHHLIPNINSKNGMMRTRTSQYFEIVLRNLLNKSKDNTSENWVTETQKVHDYMEENYHIFDYFLLKSAQDPN